MEEKLRSPQEEQHGWRSPSEHREGENRKRGSAKDGNVSEAPVGSILSWRMRGVLRVCELGCREGAKQDSSSMHPARMGLSCSTS